ncbi:MAG: NDP-sugar synthase [Bradymonadales bacterium]|jgi:mannose-1-phosphate guanylyltransferase
MKNDNDKLAGAILCAGFGTRMRPLTDYIAKPAIPFLGLPLAGYSLYALERAKIRRVGVNTHHKAQTMQKALSECEFYSGSLRYFHENGEILGTGGGFRELFRCLGEPQTTVLCHGDVLSRVDIAQALRMHQNSGAMLSLALAPRDEAQELGNVFCDSLGRIVGLRDASLDSPAPPIHELAFTGIHFIEAEVLEFIPKRGPSCLVTEVYPKLLARQIPINAIIGTHFLADVGSPERYLRATQACIADPRLLAAPPIKRIDKIKIHPSAKILEPVHLQGDIDIAADCVIGPHACLSGKIVCEAGTKIARSAVFGAGTVKQNQENAICALDYDLVMQENLPYLSK